jgi:hypothetical protein
VEELLGFISGSPECPASLAAGLDILRDECLNGGVSERPVFAEIESRLDRLRGGS